MKRLLAFLLITAILLTACQKTPEADIVVQKNTEQMIEAAKETPEAAADKTLTELYGIPESLSFTDTGADEKLTITVDAAVSAPEKPLPIVRVEAAQFSQDIVTGFWNAFLGDTPMFEIVDQQTKGDIEQSILYYRQVQAGMIDSLVEPEEAQAFIDELKAQYPYAPETIEPVPADGMLKIVTDGLEGHGVVHSEQIRATSADGLYGFFARNDYDNAEPISWENYNDEGIITYGVTVEVQRCASIICTHNISVVNYNTVLNGGDAVRVLRTDAIPESAVGLLRLTPAEAAQKAEAFLNAAGVGETIGISDIYVISDRSPVNDRSEAENYAYEVYCTRFVNGLPCASLPNAIASGMSDIKKYAPSWGYERLTFLISNEGILSVGWEAPMHITETVSDAAALKSFSEIGEIAKKMLSVKYEPEAKGENNEYVKLAIDRVTLSLQRVAEQDYFDRGLLVPVWNFFGVCTTKSADSDYINVERGSLLSINAIDGSIIDPELGY
ncbi:MAG TPA: DUF6034 family protein [Clostridia bacterium]|nr:DUF6034 family protein [Clostridia bacterium]